MGELDDDEEEDELLYAFSCSKWFLSVLFESFESFVCSCVLFEFISMSWLFTSSGTFTFSGLSDPLTPSVLFLSYPLSWLMFGRVPCVWSCGRVFFVYFFVILFFCVFSDLKK